MSSSFDLLKYSLGHLLCTALLVIAISCEVVALNTTWVLCGSVSFLVFVVATAVVVHKILSPQSGSHITSSVVLLLKLPIVIGICFYAASAGTKAAISFIVGIFVFIPALFITWMIHNVKSTS